MSYRAGKYVIEKEIDEGKLVLFNPLNYEVVKTDKKIWNTLQQNADELYDENRNIGEGIFLEKGFVVSGEIDEERLVKYKYAKECHSNGVLDLLIMPTLDCNFRCIYCYEEHNHISMCEDVQNAVVQFVKRNIRKYDSLHISWFGGEPLLQTDIIERLSNQFIDICREHKKPYTAEITTNGYLLDYETYLLMRKLKVTLFQITVDGTEKIHNKQRYLAGGGETFEKIISNLEEIKEKDSSRFVTFLIRTNLTKSNLKYDDDFDAYFEKKFGGDQRFRRRITLAWPGKDADKSIYLSEDEMKSLGSEAKDNILVGIENDNEETAKFKVNQLKRTMTACKCAKKGHFGIAPDGSVFTCEAHFDNPITQIGVINQKGNMIINEPNHSLWVTQQENSKCSKCKLYPICMSVNCPYKMSVLKKEEACADMQKVVDIIIEHLSKNRFLCKEISEADNERCH